MDVSAWMSLYARHFLSALKCIDQFCFCLKLAELHTQLLNAFFTLVAERLHLGLGYPRFCLVIIIRSATPVDAALPCLIFAVSLADDIKCVRVSFVSQPSRIVSNSDRLPQPFLALLKMLISIEGFFMMCSRGTSRSIYIH